MKRSLAPNIPLVMFIGYGLGIMEKGETRRGLMCIALMICIIIYGMIIAWLDGRKK